jgi:hypothetical protein
VPAGDDFVIIGTAANSPPIQQRQQQPAAAAGEEGGYSAARLAALAADPRLDGAAFWAEAIGEEDEDEDEDEDEYDEGEGGWDDDDDDDDDNLDDAAPLMSPAALMAELGLLGEEEEEEEEEEEGEEGTAAAAPPAGTKNQKQTGAPTTTTPPSPSHPTWRDIYTSSALPQPLVHPSVRLSRLGGGQGRGVVAAAPLPAGEPLLVSVPLGTVLYCPAGTTPENEELAAHLLLGPGQLAGGAGAAMRYFASAAGGGGGGGGGGEGGDGAPSPPPLPSSSPLVSRPAAELLLRYLAPTGPAGSAENLPLPPRALWEAAAGVMMAAEGEGDEQAPLAALLLSVPADPALAAAEQKQQQQQQPDPRSLLLPRFASLVTSAALGEASEDAVLAVLRGTAVVGESGFLGVWPAASGLLNHSCAPTASWLSLGDRLVVRAARDLSPGEQVTISYLGQGLTRPLEERRAELREVYGFECRCERCRAEERARQKAPELAAALDAVSALSSASSEGGGGGGGLAARAELWAARLEEAEAGGVPGYVGEGLDGAAWPTSSTTASGEEGEEEGEAARARRRGGGSSSQPPTSSSSSSSSSSSRARSRSRSRGRGGTNNAAKAAAQAAQQEARRELRLCQREAEALRSRFEQGVKSAALKKGSPARHWLVASAFDVYDALSVCADALAGGSGGGAEEEEGMGGPQEESSSSITKQSKARRFDAKRAAERDAAPPPLETELLASCARALAAASPGSEPACALAVELMLRAEARFGAAGGGKGGGGRGGGEGSGGAPPPPPQECRDAARLAAQQHAARYGSPAHIGAGTAALLLDTRAGLD